MGAWRRFGWCKRSQHSSSDLDLPGSGPGSRTIAYWPDLGPGPAIQIHKPLQAMKLHFLAPSHACGTLSTHEVVLDLTGHLGSITVHVPALQLPSQPIFEEGYVSKHARASSVHVTSIGSAGPASRTAVQVPDRAGTGSGNESRTVRATMDPSVAEDDSGRLCWQRVLKIVFNQ